MPTQTVRAGRVAGGDAGLLRGGDSVVRVYADTLDCQNDAVGVPAPVPSYAHAEPGQAVQAADLRTDLWGMTPNRRNIEGVRMAPDRPFPLFEENGRTYKNTYRRPRHATKWSRNVAPALSRSWSGSSLTRSSGIGCWTGWRTSRRTRRSPAPRSSSSPTTRTASREGTFGTGRGLLFAHRPQTVRRAIRRAQTFGMLDGTAARRSSTTGCTARSWSQWTRPRRRTTAYRRGERTRPMRCSRTWSTRRQSGIGSMARTGRRSTA